MDKLGVVLRLRLAENPTLSSKRTAAASICRFDAEATIPHLPPPRGWPCGRPPSENHPSRPRSIEEEFQILDLRGGRPRIISSHAHEAWEDEQLWRLKRVKERFDGPVRLSVTIYSASTQTSDLTNKVAAIEDLLVKAGIIPDDNWNVLPEVCAGFDGLDRSNRRAEVDIGPTSD